MTTQELKLPLELEELRTILKKYGVVSASVFGSYARGEAQTDSDLDLLVEFDRGKSYFDLGGLVYELEDQYDIKADVATKLNRHFEPYIRPELVTIL